MREEFEKWYIANVCEIPKVISYSESDGGYVITHSQMANDANTRMLANILNISLAAWNEKQKKLDNINKFADWHIEDCACSHPMSQYQLGWLDAMTALKGHLK